MGNTSPKKGQVLLSLTGISRNFPGVKALDNVDFTLKAGEVHVLFGENGAGKSTLISVIAGALKPDTGHIRFRGRDVAFSSVSHARSLGISAVFQEFSLVPQLTVEQNIFLGAEETSSGLLSKKCMRNRAVKLLERLGFPLRPEQRVAGLSRAGQQMVEIAKAFRADLSVLVLDEPTASLTNIEAERLFVLIRQIKARDVGVVYITHRLDEIRRIGDRITVLRDARKVATVGAGTADGELVRLMTGRVFEKIYPDISFQPGELALRTTNLTTSDGSVRDVSISVRRGEIVGLAGLVGSGKSELARACYGLVPVAAGSVLIDGEDLTGSAPRKMLERGFAYIPADRRAEGLMMMRSARENIALQALRTTDFSCGTVLRRGAEKTRTRELAVQLNLQPLRIERAAQHFSGGNQQKIMLAKSLARKIGFFAFDEPTVGVDVGTRVAIYEFIRDLCENGAAVLLVSSDLPEVLHLSRRVYVMCRGALSAELSAERLTQEKVLSHCFGKKAA